MFINAAPAAQAMELLERITAIFSSPPEAERIPLFFEKAEESATEPTQSTTEATEAPAPTVGEDGENGDTAQPVEHPRSDPWADLEKYPHYFQGDYPDVRYGSGTIATSGCGITSLAMVASYMTGYDYTPDQLAKYFGGYDASNTDRMLNAADKLQLPWRQAENWHETYEALKIGCPVIVLENEASKFTQNQHFIVLVGITEDDRVVVLDSARANYSLWDMKQGFEEGFTQAEICAGYSGSWIFDIHAMPDTPFIYQEAPRPYVENRYPGIQLTLEEENLLARVVWVESRGEPEEGQQAVAEVVLNRLISEDYPDNLRDVIYQEGQFRSVKFLEDAEPNQTQYDAIENALLGPYVLPIGVTHFATYAETPYIWGEIGGHIFCYPSA